MYHKSYAAESYDPAIVSSFLSAISMFSSNFNDDAKMLETKNYRFVYHRVGELIIVARVTRNISLDRVEQALERIAKTLREKIKFDSKTFNGSVREFNMLDSEFDKNTRDSLAQEDLKLEINPRVRWWSGRNEAERKVFSYVRFKGKASVKEIAKLMKVPEIEAWKAAQTLINMNVVRRTNDATMNMHSPIESP